MVSRLLHCCNSDDASTGTELKVLQLGGDSLVEGQAIDASLKDASLKPPWPAPITPWQRNIKSRIQLPRLRRYPALPGIPMDVAEDKKLVQLMQAYQDFVFDLHCGIYMTQLTPSQEHADIHLQLLEDLQTLKVDHGSGCIIEFPLMAASKVQRIVKNNDRWHSAGTLTGPEPMPPLPLSSAEHIVVVEFDRRKLAFVFREMRAAHHFFVCIELLIRRVQENCKEPEGEAALAGRSPSEVASLPSACPEDLPKSPGRRFGCKAGGSSRQAAAGNAGLHLCRPDNG